MDANDKYLKRFADEVLPMIESAITLIITPGGHPDPKICLELGASLLLDKPLILIVTRGRTIPARLRRLADAIVEGDIGEPDFQERVQKAVTEIMQTDKRCQ
jgi:hypothetical protein